MRASSSRFRGVVRLRSGKWGAQVCAKGNRIWLGSFCTEVAAAEAYDIAAQSVHKCHARTNFKRLSPSDSDSRKEFLFLQSHAESEIISMIWNKTYHAEFRRSLHNDHLIRQNRQHDAAKVGQETKSNRQFLFQKVVSPSDMGPAKRLVIPRQLAIEHFSSVLGGDDGGHGSHGDMIDFQDDTGKIWRFRYSFWRGNRNDLLIKGWANFACDKGIQLGDVISFWRVTNELDTKHLLISCDSRRPVTAASVPTPTQVLKPLHTPKMVRLFGFDIPITQCNQ